jgi:hypothetical protein
VLELQATLTVVQDQRNELKQQVLSTRLKPVNPSCTPVMGQPGALLLSTPPAPLCAVPSGMPCHWTSG